MAGPEKPIEQPPERVPLLPRRGGRLRERLRTLRERRRGDEPRFPRVRAAFGRLAELAESKEGATVLKELSDVLKQFKSVQEGRSSDKQARIGSFVSDLIKADGNLLKIDARIRSQEKNTPGTLKLAAETNELFRSLLAVGDEGPLRTQLSRTSEAFGAFLKVYQQYARPEATVGERVKLLPTMLSRWNDVKQEYQEFEKQVPQARTVLELIEVVGKLLPERK